MPEDGILTFPSAWQGLTATLGGGGPEPPSGPFLVQDGRLIANSTTSGWEKWLGE